MAANDPAKDRPKVTDCSIYREGDPFPSLNKDIFCLITTAKEFIVFLDEDLVVHFWMTDDYDKDEKLPDDYGNVIIQESKLEAISAGLLRPNQMKVFRTLLGESIARLLDEKETANSRAILAQAESYLKTRSGESGRMYYVSTSFILTGIILLFMLLLWIYRDLVQKLFGSVDSIDIIVGAGMGSLGAFMSILQRSDKLTVDSSASWYVYAVEATVRALAGGLGGLLVALAVKSNFILSQVFKNPDRPLLTLMLFCIVAGSSERIVPNLVQQIEGVIGGKKDGETPDGANGKPPDGKPQSPNLTSPPQSPSSASPPQGPSLTSPPQGPNLTSPPQGPGPTSPPQGPSLTGPPRA
jgi:hypothetical protein